MFLSYYGLTEQPFGVTPDARFLYLSASHREALASLVYGIKTGRGFLALIATPGMGKTTLLFQLMEQLQNTARTVFLFQTQSNSVELLTNMVTDLGLQPEGKDLGSLQKQVNAVLVREAQLGRRFVLIVDEAQNLKDEVLETVRMLSNFETQNSKLMQIVLAGQPQLAEKLTRSELTQLRQRVSVICHLDPLGPQEALAYIENRLKVAGYNGGALFTPEAMRLILERSEGIPRNINNICFHALSLGYAKQQRTIDHTTIQEVLADLDLELLRRGRSESPAQTSAGQTAGATTASARTTATSVAARPSQADSDWWKRVGSQNFPVHHPLVASRRKWLVWIVVLILLVGGGLVWKELTGNPRRVRGEAFRIAHHLLGTAGSSKPSQNAVGTQGVDASNGSSDGATPATGNAASGSSPAQSQPSQSANDSSTAAPNVNGGAAAPASDSDGNAPGSGNGAAAPPRHTSTQQANALSKLASQQFSMEDVAAQRSNSERGNGRSPGAAATQAGVGELVLESNVPGARVYINGNSETDWVTPHTFLLNVGTYWVSVRKPGHTTWYRAIYVPKGKTRWAVANLGRSSAVVEIETQPAEMPVLIDRVPYGPSPVEATLLAGQHTYKVIPRNGSQPYHGSFFLRADAVLRIRVRWPKAAGRPSARNSTGYLQGERNPAPHTGGALEPKF